MNLVAVTAQSKGYSQTTNTRANDSNTQYMVRRYRQADATHIAVGLGPFHARRLNKRPGDRERKPN